MNKDLMMKAAVQFKGVWPDDGYGLIIARPSDIILGNKERDGSVSYVSKGVTENTFLRSWSHCTREQFEDFVDSLFEGAPDDATHVDCENTKRYYRYDGREYHLISKLNPVRCANFDKLIPRPVKKLFIGDTPQQLKDGVTPWVPEIGEECKSALLGSHFTVGRLLYKSDQLVIWQDSATGAEFAGKLENRMFRPLRTERELFIEQAIKDYLDQVGSDAVNPKWFERIFGAMYDAGYTKGAAK